MHKVLIVEDDAELNKSLTSYLLRHGFDAKGVLDVNEAYDAMYEMKFDIIITDIMMSPVNGFEFADAIRSSDKSVPIIFVSARDDISAKARGFQIGIDDYMVKPINLEELELRINALMRRAMIISSKHLEIGGLVIDTDEHTAYLEGQELSLTKREFDILYKLLSYPKKTFTRTQLMDEFWDSETASSSRTVDVYITRLREKLSACKNVQIVTVHGLGYKAVYSEKAESQK